MREEGERGMDGVPHRLIARSHRYYGSVRFGVVSSCHVTITEPYRTMPEKLCLDYLTLPC